MIRTLTTALPLAFAALPITPLAAQTDDKLKLKVRTVTDPLTADKRPPVNAFVLKDRNVMVLRSPDVESGVRDHAKSAPRLELYERGKMTLLRGQDPNLKVKAGELFLVALVEFQNEPIAFAMRRDTINGGTELHWQRMDPTLTKPHERFEPLCVFDTRTYGTGKKIGNGNGHFDAFHTARSADGSKLLVYAPAVTNADGEVHRPMVVLGPGMEVVWKQTLPAQPEARFQEIAVDNSGAVFFTERLPFKPEAGSKDTTTHRIRLQQVNDDGAVEIAPGLPKGKQVKSAVLRRGAKGEVLIAGLFGGLDAKEKPMLGEFLGRLEAGRDAVQDLVQQPITIDPDDALPTARGFRMIDVLPRGDGGHFLVKEFFQETDKPDMKTAMTGLRWIHGPVVATLLDAKGKQVWSTTFHRLIYSPEKAVGNVLCIVHDKQLMLFLIDSGELAAKRKAGDKKLLHTDLKTPETSCVHFDDAGAYRAKGVMRDEFLIGEQLWRVGANEYLGLSSPKLNGKHPQLAKIDLGL